MAPYNYLRPPSILHICGYYLKQAYGAAVARQLVLSLLNDVRIIDCDHATSLMALHSTIDDMEDALQYYAALRNGVEYFISSDKKLKKAALPQLPVYTAQELLTELNAIK